MSSVWERARAAPWWAHALAYLALLVAVAPFMRWDVPFTPDEGLYGEQVEALDDGTWEWEYRARAVDPDGDWMPLVNAEERGPVVFPYVRHPAYVRMLDSVEAAAGEVAGLHLIPVAGAVGAAVATWFLASALSAPAATAFWVAALGPLLVNAQIVWAHTLSAALAGGALVAAVSLHRRWSAAAAGGLAAASFALVMVRAEGLLFAVALGVGVAVGVLGRRGITAAVGAGAPALAGLAAFAVERLWFQRIVDAAVTAAAGSGGAGGEGVGAGAIRGVRQTSGSYLGGRLNGAWHVLLEPAHDHRQTAVIGLLAMGLIALGAVVIRRRLERHEVAGPALVGAGLLVMAARFAVDPDQTATGLLAAWPIVLVALVLVRRSDLEAGGGSARMVAGIAGLFTVLVLLTQYSQGGGLEWGGRFLTPALPALAVLAALVVARAGAEVPGLGRLVPLLVVVPAVAGLVLVPAKRADDGAVADEVAAVDGVVVVTHEQVLPRYGWRHDPPLGWMLVPADEAEAALGALADEGVEVVTLVQPWFVDPHDLGGHYGDVERLPAPAVEAFGWRLHRLAGVNPGG